jgi:ribosomal-protein-alanine N-acetyltransferase
MTGLHTPRLSLFPLCPRQLTWYLDDPSALEQEIGHPISRKLVDDNVRRAIGMKLVKMAAAPEALHDWYTYWLIVAADAPFGAGLAGFKGFPDEHGEAEIGYGIDPEYRGKGYMTEAAGALIAWAFREPECLAIVARGVLRSNLASQKVLLHIGMSVYGEPDDTLSYRISRVPAASG